jgi:hypothetical protein
MTDDAPAYWNAFNDVFKPVATKRLLCAWHVDRNWRKNLCKVSDSDLQSTVYKSLCVLRLEQNPIVFRTMLDNFMKFLSEDVRTKEFAQYFSRFYFEKAEY